MNKQSTGAFIAVSRYASATPMPPSVLSRGVGWQVIKRIGFFVIETAYLSFLVLNDCFCVYDIVWMSFSCFAAACIKYALQCIDLLLCSWTFYLIRKVDNFSFSSCWMIKSPPCPSQPMIPFVTARQTFSFQRFVWKVLYLATVMCSRGHMH